MEFLPHQGPWHRPWPGPWVTTRWVPGGSPVGRGLPRYIAAYDGNTAVVQHLLRFGASSDKATEDGRTPLIIAAGDLAQRLGGTVVGPWWGHGVTRVVAPWSRDSA